MYVRISSQLWLAVFIIMELWRRFDAIFCQQGALQKPVGCYTEALVAFQAVTQGVFASLRADLG